MILLDHLRPGSLKDQSLLGDQRSSFLKNQIKENYKREIREKGIKESADFPKSLELIKKRFVCLQKDRVVMVIEFVEMARDIFLGEVVYSVDDIAEVLEEFEGSECS